MEKEIIEKVVDFIKSYLAGAGATRVVIGMSGGKDSLVVAKLCSLAVGEKNVYGLILPNGEMKDIDDAVETCKFLNINYDVVSIQNAYNSVVEDVKKLTNNNVSSITTINTAPRIRMTYLYAYAGSLNALVANTSNLSEALVGYSTKWGDNVGDFAPIADFTKTEVCELGLMLGLPKHLVIKTPSDGLSGKSDEDNLGFSYAELDDLIRNNQKGENFEKILRANKISKHKREHIAKFENGFKKYL
ncbi:MAG: NAD(+) synthase [Clostridia bacterium]|nr:NAD(+) synthase [Clostridia bacterium]